MKRLFVAVIACPLLAYGGDPTESFCNDEGLTPYPLASGWSDFAYCDTTKEQLYMIVDMKVPNLDCKPAAIIRTKVWSINNCNPFVTKHLRVDLPNGNYHKDVTGLACNIAVYKCEIERY